MTVLTKNNPGEWSWQFDAACRSTNMDTFFPSADDDSAAAKAICAECPVRMACLAFAIDHSEQFGIWGGLTEKERRRLPAEERERVRLAAQRAA